MIRKIRLFFVLSIILVMVTTTVANARTVGIIDAGKIVNLNNKYKSDYQFDLTEEEILTLYPEYELADIKDFKLEKTSRNPVTTKSSPNGYSAKLEYLINNNILNRYNNYVYNKYDTVITDSRVTHNPENEATNTFKHKYYNPNDLVSKSDFVSNLMKTQEVQRSRIIAIQNPYTASDVQGQLQQLTRQPIEESPYQDKLGELGIDSVNNDIIINYSTFNTLNLIATNDVTEQYLYKALQLGLIKNEDFGGVEGQEFLSNLPDINEIPIYGSWYDNSSSIRQYYNEESKLSPKELESIKLTTSKPYFNFLNEYLETLKPNQSSLVNSKEGLAYPWGNSFYYNIGRCNFGNVFNQDDNSGVEIIKRPSIIEYRTNNIPDPKENGQGYQYFTREELTVAESYVLAYNFLELNNVDTKLSQEEIDYVNSAFGLDFGKMNAEEQEAVKYLLAKGIIDPNDDRLKFATSNSLSNEYMIEILYRVHNNEARFEVNTNLSELDKDMLNKGFSQASIERVDNISTAEPVFSYTNNTNTSWTDSMIQDRLESPEFYDYIYVKMPNGFDITRDTVKAVTDDEYRVPIPPVSRQLVGANSDNKLINPPEEHKQDYYLENSPFVLNDTTFDTPQVWQRYIVHKNISSNLKLNIIIDGKTRTYNSFSGEGIYYPNNESDDNINVNLYKLPINQTKSKLNSFNKPTYYNLYKYVIENDLAMRNDVYMKTPTPIMSNLFINQVFANDTAEQPEQDESLDSKLQNQTDVLQGTLRLGSYTETQLKSLTYNGSVFIKPSTESPSGYEIDLDVVQSTFNKNRLKNVTIEKEGDKYYLVYPAYSSSVAYDMATFIDSIGQFANTDTGSNSKYPAYAQITADNQEIVLISEDDIKNTFNVEIINDKLLLNKTTGQKAFLNTDESFTLIGNNITKYPKDKMFVIAMGEKRFYNLDIILELLNDVDLAQQKLGKKILVGEYDNYGFQKTDIYDTTSIENKNSPLTSMDTTYTIYNKDNPNSTGVYTNLSALSSRASNFIFLKDYDKTNLQMLVVYYPKSVDIKNADTTNNDLFAATKKMLRTTTTDNVKRLYTTNTQTLSRYIFSAGGYELETPIDTDSLHTISMDVLSPNYQYDIYFLSQTSSEDNLNAVFNDFKEKMLTIEGGDYLLKNSIIDNALDANLGLSDTDFQNTNIKFSVIKTLPNIKDVLEGSKDYFYVEKGSKNLYFRTQQPITANSTAEDYRKIFKNRLYSTKITSSGQAPIIYFRPKTYYTDTPEDYVPLEYLTINPTIGSFDDTSGKGKINLFLPQESDKQKMYLTVESVQGSTNSTGANTIVSPGLEEASKKKETQLALFTNVVGRGTRQVSDLISIYDGKNIKETSIFLNDYSYANSLVFEKEYNEAVYGKEGKFLLSSADVTNGISQNSSSEFILDAYNYTWSIPKETYGDKPFVLFGKPRTYHNSLEGYVDKFDKDKPIMVVDGNKVKKYKSDVKTKDILKDYLNLQVPNYLPIPAGTTVVSPDGKLETITSSTIRTEVTYMSDVINNILSKLILKNKTITLLSDVPDNSIVNFDGRVMLKTGGSNLKKSWQQLMILPTLKSDTENYSYSDVTDYNILYKLYLEVFNKSIPNVLGASGSKTNLLQLSGNGLWALPEYNLLVDTANKSPNKNIFKYMGDDINIWTYGEDNQPMLINYKNETKIKEITNVMSDKKTGYITPIINVVPTLVVEQAGTGVYNIVGYIDPAIYSIDLRDSYSNYLNHRNTDAFSPTKILNSIKSLSFNGEYYRQNAKINLLDVKLFDIIRFLEEFIAILVLLQWAFVTFFYAIQHVGVGTAITTKIQDISTKDIVKIISLGLFSCYDDSSDPSNIRKYWVYFLGVVLFCLLMWNGYLVNFILYLLNFILGGI